MLIAAVAILCIGPKDMPRALRTAGRWMGKMRRMSNHVRSGMETMIREVELEEMEQKWREQNAAIMQEHPHGLAPVTPALIEHAPPPHVADTVHDADYRPAQSGQSSPAPLPPVPPAATAE